MGWIIVVAGTIFGIDALFHHVHDYSRYAIAGGFILVGVLVGLLMGED